MKKITLATFRRVDAAHESMIRACMPSASVVSAPLDAWHAPSAVEVLAARVGSRLVRSVAPLTATIAERVS